MSTVLDSKFPIHMNQIAKQLYTKLKMFIGLLQAISREKSVRCAPGFKLETNQYIQYLAGLKTLLRKTNIYTVMWKKLNQVFFFNSTFLIL